jgi:hypothetical protein
MTSLNKTGGRLTFLLAVGALWACDIPTDSPMTEQKWAIPLSFTSVPVGEFLPDAVGFNEDSSAFTVQIDAISFEEDLGTLCPACAGFDGLTVPKPAFAGSFSESVVLPEDVASVEVQEGVVVVEAQNRFTFDPLRPPGGERGTITLALRAGGPNGEILDQIVVDGATDSFAPGTRLSRELEYSGDIGGSISVTVEVDSPAGGLEPGNWVLVRLNDEVVATATPEDVEASTAEIEVAGETYDLEPTDLDVEDVLESTVEKVQSGTLHLNVVNPWSLGAVATLTIIGPTMAEPVVLIAPIPAAPTSSVEVALSQADLQAFLGQPNVVLTGQGTVDQNAGTIGVAPAQTMTIGTDLDLTLLIG